jgi:hypothetical protein
VPLALEKRKRCCPYVVICEKSHEEEGDT